MDRAYRKETQEGIGKSASVDGDEREGGGEDRDRLSLLSKETGTTKDEIYVARLRDNRRGREPEPAVKPMLTFNWP